MTTAVVTTLRCGRGSIHRHETVIDAATGGHEAASDGKRRHDDVWAGKAGGLRAIFDRIGRAGNETMTDGPEPESDSQAARPRLESWKEIAAYLRRDVRTVQRWEQTDGLPIHRHRRAQRPLPYAYRAELDAWWASRSDASDRTAEDGGPGQPPGDRRGLVAVAVLSLAVVVAAGGYWTARSQPSTGSPAASSAAPAPVTSAPAADGASAPASTSVAVLPFVDLTEGMTHEEFADGMAEEIINRLSAVPGYRVPAPTSTFYFKNKTVPVTDIARALRVAFVVDGSVRRSGDVVRVAARLIRADGAEVIWSESYDRSWQGALPVQDDIAAAAAQAITAAIGTPGANPRRP